MFQGFLKNVSRMFQGSFSSKYFKEVQRVFQGSLKGGWFNSVSVSRVFQGCFKKVLRMFRKIED